MEKKCVKNNVSFEIVFLDILNKYAPIKKTVIRASHAPYVTKSLRKAIMKRSHLQNIYVKKTPESLKKLKKHKNYCSRLHERERKRFFSNPDSAKIVTLKHSENQFNLFC